MTETSDLSPPPATPPRRGHDRSRHAHPTRHDPERRLRRRHPGDERRHPGPAGHGGPPVHPRPAGRDRTGPLLRAGHRRHPHRTLLEVQLHHHHQHPERPALPLPSLRDQHHRRRHVRPGHAGHAPGHRDRPPRRPHGHRPRGPGRGRLRLLRWPGRLGPHALRRPHPGHPGAGHSHRAGQHRGQAGRQLVLAGHHHRRRLVDLHRPVGARRLPRPSGSGSSSRHHAPSAPATAGSSCATCFPTPSGRSS